MTRDTKIRFWLIGLVVFVALLYLLRGVLLPFVAGMAIAYFLDPLADRLERMGVSRLLATVIIVAGFFLLIILLALLLIPVLQSQIVGFAASVPRYIDSFLDRIQPLLAMAEEIARQQDLQQLREAAGNFAGTVFRWLGQVLTGLASGGLAVVNLLSLLFITPIVTFYMIRDWDRMVAKVDSWLPRAHADTIRAQMRQIDGTLAGFLRGQAMVCLTLGAFYAIGLSLAGLEIGLIVGLGAGLISFIPYVGTMVGFVVGVGLALAQGEGWALPAIVAAIFMVGQLVEGNFLTPKLVGERIGLHPVWVIFALLAGGALFGFVGILLAVPVAAVIGVLLRFSLTNYLDSRFYSESDPSSDQAA